MNIFRALGVIIAAAEMLALGMWFLYFMSTGQVRSAITAFLCMFILSRAVNEEYKPWLE